MKLKQNIETVPPQDPSFFTGLEFLKRVMDIRDEMSKVHVYLNVFIGLVMALLVVLTYRNNHEVESCPQS